jgi:sulfatase modifying factor 1
MARHGFFLLVGAVAACGLPLGGTDAPSGDGGAETPLDAGVDRQESVDGATDATQGGPMADGTSNEVDAGHGGASDGPPSDGDGDQGANDDAVASNGCPVTQAGPTMAPVGGAGFCIDTTEVTNAQYAAFLAGAHASKPPAVCNVGKTYQPTNGWPYAAGADELPVVWIDWCDAYAYCQWAGKRLCGHIGGGSNPQSAVTDPTQSQWYRACSADGARAYPYGAAYQAGACYGAQGPGAQLMAVATHSGCVGGYPGIFDMSGSVWEWEDSCSAETGGNDYCQIRGGSLLQDSTGLGCQVGTVGVRSSATGDRGFRCCAP